jgi:nitrous oxidase accessory protein NosD
MFIMTTFTAAAASTRTVGNVSSLPCTGDFPTIQAAVNAAAPGDIIKVCPGTYPELVNVNKKLIMNGAQSGVDARSVSRTGLPATESVVTGTAGSTSFYVTADDVVIDGFTIQDNTSANAFGAGIVLGAGTSGAHVIDNIIQNNLVGLFLANKLATDQALIQHNRFRNNTQPGPASGHGIYSDEYVAGLANGVSNVLIDSNDFVNDNGAVTGTWGIGISNTGVVPFTNLTIQGNKFDSASPASRGMYFYGTHSSSIIGNSIQNKTNYAIGFFGGDDGITIQCNTLVNSNRGINLGDAFPTANSNITATYNNISGNVTAGVEVDTATYSGGAGSFNAEKNWWGSAAGPTIASNPGGTGDKILDPDGVVDYSPFLTSVQGLPCPTPIVGPPTNKDQCKDDGWKSFNVPRKFKNQGDCIQYVNTGK